jgi:Bacterial aa3 type cytochrome c oxidase subunit IV
MATPPADHNHDYQRGAMDIQEQASTYDAFMALTKWGSLTLVAGLVALVVWFCTPAGFLPGFIGAVVVAVGGIVLLREKPAAH